jgi:DNA mismatch repair ATPase MutS
MKAFLMYRDRDFNLEAALPPNSEALSQDLELDVLFAVMAQGDKYLYEVASKAVLQILRNEDEVRYRQDVLRDVLANPILVRFLYDLAIEAHGKEKKAHAWMYLKSPSSILGQSVDLLQGFVALLKQLRGVGTYNAKRFPSEGFTRFFAMLDKELNNDYFVSIQEHLNHLKFRDGVLISAELGTGFKGANHTLRKPNEQARNWIERLTRRKPPGYTWRLPLRDEAGANALGELRDRGLNLVANALAQSDDHILSFFDMLHTELAFYVGCLNLHEQLLKLRQPISFPEPAARNERKLTFSGLYDVCLTFKTTHPIIGNDLRANGRDLVIITGANTGGKTTFLRSVGLAQLMMQCGMFVGAESFSANMCSCIFTHYVREEETTMKSGKLDEELGRFSAILDSITPDALVLFNESFSATNEREGSEIARQITSALLERRIEIFYVTHLYDFAHSIYEKRRAASIFLRAERQADGSRTFKLVEAEPLQTGYGDDLYNEIFGTETTESGKTSGVRALTTKDRRYEFADRSASGDSGDERFSG